MLYVLILMMLGLVAFFAASETAFVAANRFKAEVSTVRQGKRGTLVTAFLQHPIRLFTTTLVGTNISLILYSTAFAWAIEPFIHLYTQQKFPVLVIQTILGSLLVLLLGEVIPKNIAQKRANQFIFLFAIPLQLTYWFLYPIIKPAAWISNGLAKWMKADISHGTPFVRQEIEAILKGEEERDEIALREDRLDEEEREMVTNLLEFRDLRVREVMITRTQSKAMSRDTRVAEVRATFTETGHSKLPVYEENVDHIVGYVFMHDFLRTPPSLASVMRPIRFVPESKRVNELLREFLTAKSSIAVVLDEHAGTAGLVTIEDLLEELIGDIKDEHDQEDVVMRVLDEHTFLVGGQATIEDLEERFGLRIPEGDYETLAGYLMDHMGEIPAQNSSITLEGIRYIIIKASARQIETVKIVCPALD